MQKIFAFTLLFFSILSSQKSLGQIKEGHFQYAILTTAVDTSLEARQKVGLMQNSKMDVFFTQNKSRIDFNIGTLSYSCIVVDHTIPRAMSLNKSSQGAVAVYLGKDVLNKTKEKDSTVRVELLNDTKTILGFECKKAIMYQGGEITIYWYTDEIQIEKSGNPLLNENIPGFPMSFVKIADGMKIEYIVSNYESSIEHKEVVFSLMIPEGYKLMNN